MSEEVKKEEKSFLGKLKHDIANTSYRVYIIFALCILGSVLLTACMSVGPSKRFVENSHKNAQELLPVVIQIIEHSKADVLQKSIREEDRLAMKNATKNGVEIYKMGLIRKIKNWHFDIQEQYKILQKHQKKISKE